jgi:hypothetical protein
MRGWEEARGAQRRGCARKRSTIMPAQEQAQVLPLKLYIFHVHIRAMTIAEGIAIPPCQHGEIESALV